MINIHARLRVYHPGQGADLKGLYKMEWQFDSYQDLLNALISFNATQHELEHRSEIREIHENNPGLPLPEGITLDRYNVIIEEMKIVEKAPKDPGWVEDDELLYHAGASQAFMRKRAHATPSD